MALSSGPGEAAALETARRSPQALAIAADYLVVVNREGSLTLIHRATRQVVAQRQQAAEWTDAVWDSARRLLWAVDRQHARLCAWRIGAKAQCTLVDQLPLPASPQHVAISSDQRRIAVSCRWPQTVVLVQLPPPRAGALPLAAGSTRGQTRLRLPFCPGRLVFGAKGRRLIAADAFGGQVAVIACDDPRVLAVREAPGQNVQGLTLAADDTGILLSMQQLNARLPTERERIFWGGVLSNVVVQIAWEDLLREPARQWQKRVAHWELYPLGEPGRGAGDPGQLLLDPRGRWIILLSGVNEVGLRRSQVERLSRIDVGRRPVAACFDPDRPELYVANALDGSISVINWQRWEVQQEISLGPQPARSLAEQGERLFFDAQVSLDGWFSCHSCHTEGHTNGRLNDNFGDLTEGTPKSIPTLLGVAATGPWSWSGRHDQLDAQIVSSLKTTMRGEGQDRSRQRQARALAAYLRSLRPPAAGTSVLDGEIRWPAGVVMPEQARTSDDRLVEQGAAIFSQRCADCHHGDTYTSADVYDVGLADEAGTVKFNPPSLRGIRYSAPYFHDHRAETLRDVIDRFGHPEADRPLEANAIEALLAFLRTL